MVMKSVLIVDLPGMMLSSKAISIDVLSTANRIARELQRAEPFHVTVARPDADLKPSQLLILPGLGCTSEQEVETALASSDAQDAVELIRKHQNAGATIAASCASTFLLAETGLLDGCRATTSWWLAPCFAKRYPLILLSPDQITVEDGCFVTGGAAMAQMDVMLRLVARFGGVELAQLCARYLLLDERRLQSPYVAIGTLAAQDERIARAETWARANLDRAFTIEEMARSTALSPRTFARRLSTICGMSPGRFVQRVRIESAINMLAGSAHSVEEISRRVGYADASTLRRILKRETGSAPSRFRIG